GGDRALQDGCELAAGTAPVGPEVDHHRNGLRTVQDRSLEGGLRDVHASMVAMPGRWIESGGVRLAAADDGSGTPVVLLHGLTATRRYVVMGSRALERSDHRVIAYDARGHGSSSPASGRGAYGYEHLVADLEAVLDFSGVPDAVLVGSSMGAHTILRLALMRPERARGLVVITPGYNPSAADDP